VSAHTPDLSALLDARVATWPGAQTYEVGGAVRDRLIGLSSKDHDFLVTGLPAEMIPSVFAGDRVDLVGASFGVYKISLKAPDGTLTETVDVALPRTEVSTGSGHRDFSVQTDHTLSIETDLSRRDFTFNALAVNVRTGQLIDPFGGEADLHDRRLRFVGDAHARITEDPLRILRAYRFAVKLDLNVPSGPDRAALIDAAPLLDRLPAERVMGELWTLLSYPQASAAALARTLYWMHADGILARIIPGYRAAARYDQNSRYHDLNLADHMIEAVAHAQRIGADPATKLALLLHDLGKPATRSIGEDGNAHYYRHEEVGADLAQQILSQLRAPNQVTEDVSQLILHHMRFNHQTPGDKALRRFINDLGPLWRASLDHRYADMQAHGNLAHTEFGDAAAWRAEMIRRCEALEQQVVGLSDHTLALSGTDILRLTGCPPGRAVGIIKQRLTQRVVDGHVPNDRDALIAELLAPGDPA